ncbi:MAG: GNAT family N-acetyltransferase [Candidatus Heimdallarchaeota archaeon]|nr:GNAT family N-acetyltransferase [Candidatus Heimdallarchaeota archaeon]MCK4252887.1 GNAT family N-acetyltransferase [Candidatus Heimdallarchaeota archaeon]
MIQYKRADLNDVTDLVNLRIKFLYEAEEIDKETSSDLLEKSLTKYFTIHLQNGEFIAWLAIEDNLIVATSGVSFSTVPPSFGNVSGAEAYIMNMYTLPQARKKGIGTILLGKLIEAIAKKNIKKVRLLTTEIGKSMYIRAGFKENSSEMVLNLKE